MKNNQRTLLIAMGVVFVGAIGYMLTTMGSGPAPAQSAAKDGKGSGKSASGHSEPVVRIAPFEKDPFADWQASTASVETVTQQPTGEIQQPAPSTGGVSPNGQSGPTNEIVPISPGQIQGSLPSNLPNLPNATNPATGAPNGPDLGDYPKLAVRGVMGSKNETKVYISIDGGTAEAFVLNAAVEDLGRIVAITENAIEFTYKNKTIRIKVGQEIELK